MPATRYTAGIIKILTRFPFMCNLEGAKKHAYQAGYGLLCWEGDIWSYNEETNTWHDTGLDLTDFEC